MPKTLWVTYAWVNNEGLDVDHIISQLKKAAIEVNFDRMQIIAGQRLWPQINKAILASDAWAIVATENSLKSEPCQEELAYALDKALRAKGSTFPIIGIFPKPIDRSLVPSAIATRLYVSLQDKDWVERVKSGVEQTSPKIDEPGTDDFVANVHGSDTLEIRPRSGRWYPAIVAVKKDSKSQIKSVVSGPAGRPPGATITAGNDFEASNGWKGFRIHHEITNLRSMYATFTDGFPDEIAFGPSEGNAHIIIKK